MTFTSGTYPGIFCRGAGGIMVGFKEKGLPPLPPCHLPPAQAGPLLSCPPASSSCVPALPPSCQPPLAAPVTRCFLAPLLLAQTTPSASHAAALLSRCWLKLCPRSPAPHQLKSHHGSPACPPLTGSSCTPVLLVNGCFYLMNYWQISCGHLSKI